MNAPRAGPHLRAPVFAALGDPTRLSIVTRLGKGPSLSISKLAEDSTLTRQAITKHLTVLRDAGLVRGVRRGRERVFELEPRAIDDARRALERISLQWGEALSRLRAFVEE